ncbi:MAG TPA: ATP-binding protein [Candidatus Xenobia bacterium]
MSSGSGVVIHIDPVEAAENKADRDRTINLVLFPRYRAVGFVLLTLAVILHNAIVRGHVYWAPVGRLAAGYALYCLGSWWILRHWYQALRDRVHLGTLFMALDLVAWTCGIYVSGGQQSRLFFVLLLRSADQVPIGPRRVMGFGAVGIACYLAMLAWVHQVDGVPVAWSTQVAKMLFLGAASSYLVFPALENQRLRAQNAALIRAARDALGALNAHAIELEEARVNAEQAARVKGEFVRKISHELRTPMNGILGMTDLALETELTGEQREYLTLARRSSVELLAIISGLLDFSAMERGEVQLSDQPFRVREVLERVCRACLEKARAKTLEVEWTAAPDVPEALVGDGPRLEQVLLCLGDNAVKFSERGKVAFDTRVLEVSEDTVRLRFTVSDNGPGIPADKRDLIFESFRGSDDSLTRRHGGFGLGLTISQHLVGLMGGRISVLSEAAEGTQLSFDIPFAKA